MTRKNSTGAPVAGLVAGALSMAAGEYVSVSSQRDSETADLQLERRELGAEPEGELRELATIYERRGLAPDLASQVAQALSDKNALEAHARDELGLSDERRARPIQAAGASALSFAAGAILPLQRRGRGFGSRQALGLGELLAPAAAGAACGAPPSTATFRQADVWRCRPIAY